MVGTKDAFRRCGEFQVSIGVGMASSAKRDLRDPKAAGGSLTREKVPSLDRLVQAQIGDKLRSMYGELAEQPVPDRLTQILDRLGRGKA